ncbi:hypothetical protein GJ689_07725 [Rhodoplanes serenus]|uniref:Uncharacterized protein n=1 Tax=Rhodoplanes serenus TaxID=200615 RepID=A0A9X4XJA3_9BRAD|nr:hypothetical protein [Rhodoplanes serenus]MTW16095.1 hypothetical protein [Rhodoplanes serenus]
MINERKAELPKPRRVPPYVSRRTAAALLDLSTSGFNSWVRNGTLPPPMPGTPAHESRWSWGQIERWLAGDRTTVRGDLFTPAATTQPGKRRGPPRGTGGRPHASNTHQEDCP